MTSSHPVPPASRAKMRSMPVVAFALASLTVCTLIVTTASAQISTSVQPSSTPAPTVARGNSTVRGRVVYDDTGRPLRRVRVMLYITRRDESAVPQQRMAITDARGEFTVKNVVAGKYFVFVEAPGIVRQTAFGDSPDELTSVSVDGTSNAEVQVRARRGGSITGKVTYTDGDPAVNAMVSLLLKKGKQFVPYFAGGFDGGAVVTDDRGVYRLFGLPPGEYVIGVGEVTQRVVESEEGGGGYSSNYGTLSATFYPSVTSKTASTPVAVEAGQETSNINITIAERSLHKISGTIRARRDGQIITLANISIMNKQELDGGMNNLGTQSVNVDAQGRWYFDDVPDGEYVIIVNPIQDELREARTRAAQGVRTQGFVEKRMDVVVAGVDVTGLTIEVTQGARISGTVVVEGGKPLPQNVIVFTKDASSPDSSFRNGRSAQAQAKPDGTFTMESVPEGILSVLASVAPGGKYFTKAVTSGGADLLRDPLNVEDEVEIKDVRITISAEVATLSGRLLSAENGKAMRGVGIMLIPADPETMRVFGARAYGASSPDGTYTLSGAPGDYLAIVWRQSDGAYNPELIKARAQNAPRVTLQPNERKSMDLVIPADK
jgi:hypothetical protein